MKQIPRLEIEQILAELKGTCGLYIEHLGTGEVFEVNGDKVLPSASVIKVPMLALLLKDVHDGIYDWKAPQAISEENTVGGSGILYHLDRYYQPSLESTAKLMIQLSDNMCTNHIMDLIGMERFNEYWAENGYSSFKLMRKMMDWAKIAEGKNNFLSAGDIGRLLVQIGRGELISKEICDTIIHIMRGQQLRGKLPALIPSVPGYMPPEAYETVAEGMVLVACKSGSVAKVSHDVGIFDLPDGSRYVIAMLTADLEKDMDGTTAISKVSKVCYDAFK
ncbi:MAG: serine hydrolase [Lachnospiraceae bacterium]|nr:serine hydrolase [Lachnospiraceae bacterium]